MGITSMSNGRDAQERTLEEEYRAIRISPMEYKLILPKGSYAIYSGESSSSIDFKVEPIFTNGDTTIVTRKGKRLFFAVVDEVKKDTTLLTERLIALTGPVNFRDLGGIKNKEKKTIKWGFFYRSDELAGIPDEEFAYFESTGIKTVYDLRSSQEVLHKQDNLPKDVSYIHFPIFSESEKNKGMIHAVMQEFSHGAMTEQGAREFMLQANVSFVKENTIAYKELIQRLFNAKEPVLFHCTAGKDRTGFTAALILSILDVDKKVIMDDYLMTNYYIKDQLIERLNSEILKKHKLDPEVIRPMMVVDRAYLQAGFDQIDIEYGGMDAFIKDGLGISDEQRSQYVARFTY